MKTKSPYSMGRRTLLGVAANAVGAASIGLLSGTRLARAAEPAQRAPAIVRAPNKIVMKVATIVAESFPYVDGLRHWKKVVEERTAGTVEMQVYHTAQLGDERTINEGVLAQSIQVGIGAGAWAGYVQAYNVVELPFIIRDLKHMYQLADGDLGERIAAQAEQKGFKVLAYYSAGDGHFQTRNKPIHSLADIKGLKMRVIENRALVEGFKAFGAVPTPLPYPQIYTALQQGTVDGTANDFLSVNTLKLYEVVKYLTYASYIAEPRPVIMSKAYFDGLPADLRTLLVETAHESAVYERKVVEERLAGAADVGKKNGLTLLHLTDREKWVDAVRPVWDEFGKAIPGAADLIKAILRTA